MTQEELIEQLKTQIIDHLSLEDLQPSDIDADAPLFGDAGLGLDSIDAIELVLLLEKNYKLKVEADKRREVLATVRKMAEFIEANQKA